MKSFVELWEALSASDESVEIEAKRAEEIGRSVQETVCAFANEPGRGGGYLLLGVDTEETLFSEQYSLVGVNDPDKVQADLATQCREVFNFAIRPDLRVVQHDGKTVIVAFIAEAPPHEKPVFIRSRGLPAGAFRRIGSTDQKCTDEDIEYFYQQRGQATYDETPLPEVDPVSCFDAEAIAEYRRVRAGFNPSAAELRYSDADLLHSLCATTRTKDGRLVATLCGLLAFGSVGALRRYVPLVRLDYIRVSGREWERDPSGRFQTVELRGPLLTLIPRIIATVLDDLPKAFTLGADQIHREEIPAVPQQVLREAIVNAVMHRSYRAKGAIQIIRYSNRLELRNPGHSLKPDDRLGEPGSLARNEKLAAILHETGLAETKGSGIRVMRDLMRTANLTAPIFESDRERDTFSATFLVHHFFNENDVRWLSAFSDCELTEEDTRALLLVRELGAINNAVFRNLTGLETLAASARLRRLRDVNLLAQQGKGNQTYYVPGSRLVLSIEKWRSLIPEQGAGDGEFQAGGIVSEERNKLSEELNSPLKRISEELAELTGEVPVELRDELSSLGKRVPPETLDEVVVKLCRWRPLTLAQLAALTDRQIEHLRQRSLRRLINRGRIGYVHPNLLTHPSQKYVAL